MAAAKKNLVTAITNGCAVCKPIFVAADADAHKMAKNKPAINNLKRYEDEFFTGAKIFAADEMP